MCTHKNCADKRFVLPVFENCKVSQKEEDCNIKKRVTCFTIRQQAYGQQTGKQACRLPYGNIE